MAYDKIIVIDRRLDHCLDYALNEEKTALSRALDYGMNPTKTRHLVTGINCCPETACSEMQATKRRWDKRGGIQGYHIIHSYAPGEVTPEEAHEAGVEFARRLLGDRYKAVVSTHTDQEHLHCHIVFNSVSFMDGEKYRSDFQSYFGALRETSNAVSREYGLSVIEPEGGGKHYAEWKAEKTGRGTISGLVRQDIDAAIRESFTFESFLTALRRQGYTIKYGENIKHTAVTPPGGRRAFRLDSLGEGYSEADIRSRLAAVRSGEAPAQPAPPPMIPKRYRVNKGSIRQQPRRKLRGFRALYVYYLFLLGAPPAEEAPPAPLLRPGGGNKAPPVPAAVFPPAKIPYRHGPPAIHPGGRPASPDRRPDGQPEGAVRPEAGGPERGGGDRRRQQRTAPAPPGAENLRQDRGGHPPCPPAGPAMPGTGGPRAGAGPAD